MRALTGGAVERVSQVQRLIGWLAGRGVHTASLDEDTLDALTGTPDLPDDVARALELRQAGSSASVKKLFALLNAVCPDGRLRELFTYHGAHTGRTTGSGVQPTNLPGSGPSVYRCDKCRRYFAARCCPWCGADVLPGRGEWKAGAAADCLEAAGAGSPALLRGYFGDPLTAVGGCMRGLFTAAPGHRLVCSDYSAIEAVVLAELAGETWRQEVFRSHGKIYEMSAARTSGVPFEEILAHRERTEQHHPLRKTGKVQELALGYGGWIQALRDFGGDAFFASEEDMKQAILRWRSDSPAIVAFWGGQSVSDYGRRRPSLHGLEGMAVAALLDRGTEYAYQSAHGIAYVADTEALYCRLPSGRCLTYHRARLEPSERRAGEWQIVFEGWNTNPVNGPVGWITKRTYGGRLAENVVQAVSRDIQWHGMRALEAAGYPVVLHVYDEDVCEVLQDRGSVEEMERIMSDVPAWAAGWPVRATGGWFGHRYRKD
jgi:DNA polymerase